MDDAPFHHHVQRYDRWYDTHRPAYEAELAALRALLPPFTRALEIGVGTGRFAAPLGFHYGLDPALPMLRLARRRGIRVVAGRGEALPFARGGFDLVALVFTLCFVEDWPRLERELRRVLRPGGHLLVGLLDWGSQAGRRLARRRAADPFYRHARPTTPAAVTAWLAAGPWGDFRWCQTLADPERPQPPRPGFGDGLFAVLRARRLSSGE